MPPLSSSPVIGPNTAFVLIIFGVLAIYCEFLWPGRIYPVLVGSASVAVGAYFLLRLSPSARSLWLIGAAVVLYGIEALWRTYFIAGGLGTAALATGFSTMFRDPPWIVPGFAIPICCVFGAVTCFLCYAARRARNQKWSDIDSR